VDVTGDETLDTGGTGVWLKLADAARHLGLSEKTVRRRLKDGGLQGRQVATVHGPTWEVWVDTAGTLDGQGTQTVKGDAVLELVRLVDRLQRENLELGGRIGWLQAENQRLQETVLMLEAGPTVESEQASNETTVSDAPRVSWWRRFFGV
jgi:hypothetical protein